MHGQSELCHPVSLQTLGPWSWSRRLGVQVVSPSCAATRGLQPKLPTTPQDSIISKNKILNDMVGKLRHKSVSPGHITNEMDSSTCLALALEGERLCKTEDCRAGVAFFEAALQTGTDDLRTLSAIYSQLGNAYFYLGEYNKAMEYHKLDLTVARTMGDRLGVAKASGNLGNTLKVMGRFKEAIICCERHLSISQELGDKVGEGRALYNLGNVYHAYGKHSGRAGPQEPGEVSEEVKHWLIKAVEYYAANLKLVQELNDRSAQGRACGNLGNTHYLLGNFTQAVSYHHERLLIAKEFGDKAAERRALSNLGNAHIFLGDFETASDLYLKTLQLAQELSDRAVEAQACYSLGNTYTLLRDYPTAIEYHHLHLSIAQELSDKIGESRACWSLGNAYSAIDNHEKALSYAKRHLEISVEIGDKTGQAAAQMHLSDLRRILGLPSTSKVPNESEENTRPRRRSMENMDLLKMTPDTRGMLRKHQSEDAGIDSLSSDNSHTSLNVGAYELHNDKNSSLNEESSIDDENFFELLSRFQSKRMDDQRCTLIVEPNKENSNNSNNRKSSNIEEIDRSSTSPESSESTSPSIDTPTSGNGVQELMEMIAGMQSQRMDEQRASLPKLPGFNNQEALLQQFSCADSTSQPDDSFFDMLIRCQVMDRFLNPHKRQQVNDDDQEPCTSSSIENPELEENEDDDSTQKNTRRPPGPNNINLLPDGGPTCPNLKKYPSHMQGGQTRSFNKRWHQQYSWPEYSVVKDAAYCFACHHFTTSYLGRAEQSFTHKGFKNWKKATMSLKAHDTSAHHKFVMQA
ncbi:G-protein-signaling modulator 2-like isoform X2 [Oratosquilla oratoria]|uniref:G-protein-signaling modulator 2-like isoform X2 n=1 Tax=Oratosquilla oratoria TaxID=337810 RepID=UPI003F76BC67